MTRANLGTLSVDQLVDRFAQLGVAQDNALWDTLGETNRSSVNRLFYEMRDLDNEFRARGRDARLALTQLYDHRNIQVRLMAARLTLGVAPLEARKIIEEIAASKIYPQAGDAGMTLVNLERGIFKPD